MEHYYWSDWYSGWGWFLWFGLILVMFSSFGNWGYTYRAHRRFDGYQRNNALDTLNQRYASGEIQHEEYLRIKSHIAEGGLARPSSKGDARTNLGSIKPTY